MIHRSSSRRPARPLPAWPSLLLALACAGGPPKDTRTSTDDEKEIHELGARVEELTALAEARELYLMTPCAATMEGCELARRLCEIAARHPGRADMQDHCAIAQADCTRMDDLCMQRR